MYPRKGEREAMTDNEIVKLMVKGIIINTLIEQMIPAQNAERRADLLWENYKQNKLENEAVKIQLRSHEYDVTAALINLRKNGFDVTQKKET